jgi:peptidoglycan/xylan/chitin deacetylase (PgdA/CDA1 family)
MTKRQILLSFDVEEFDAPIDFGGTISPEDQIRISSEGLERLLSLLQGLEIRATFFSTAFYAKARPDLIRSIALNHEVASHGYYHSSFKEEDLEESKKVLEEITQKPVQGFRRARLEQTNQQWISDAGYFYNSSENPTFIPGRYCKWNSPRTYYFEQHLLNIPVSTVPYIRFPLFWLSFKHLPVWFLRPMLKATLMKDHYLSLYFHPWEFADLKNVSLPYMVKRVYGKKMIEILRTYLQWLKQEGDFITYAEFTEQMTSSCVDKLHKKIPASNHLI